MGHIELDLLNFMRGVQSYRTCNLEAMYSPEWEKLNLLHMRQLSGWWPFSNLTRNSLQVFMMVNACYEFFF